MDRFAKKSETDLALSAKVDKVTGYGLSQESFSTTEKNKLSTLSNLFKGTFTSEANLNSAYPTGEEGWEALVDAGIGTDAIKYIWDTTDNKWVQGGGSGASTFSDLTGNPFDNAPLALALNAKEIPPVATGEKFVTQQSDGTHVDYEAEDLIVSNADLLVADWSSDVASVTGLQGQISYSSNYRYDCVAENQWRRSALNGSLVDLYLADVDDSGGDKTTNDLNILYPTAVNGQRAWGINNLYEKKSLTVWKKTPSINA